MQLIYAGATLLNADRMWEYFLEDLACLGWADGDLEG